MTSEDGMGEGHFCALPVAFLYNKDFSICQRLFRNTTGSPGADSFVVAHRSRFAFRMYDRSTGQGYESLRLSSSGNPAWLGLMCISVFQSHIRTNVRTKRVLRYKSAFSLERRAKAKAPLLWGDLREH